MDKVEQDLRTGYAASTLAFLWWGLVPIYFKALAHVSATEILAHRIFWCVPTVLLIMFFLKKPVRWIEIIKDKKLLLALFLSTVLVSNNWFIFTWAVVNDRVLDTSLGYFINPLLSVVLGVFILGETLRRLQWIAVGIASLGVLNQILLVGVIPWLSLALAITFGLYGLVRKKAKVDSLNGLLVETSLAFPVAGLVIGFLMINSESLFLNINLSTDLLLIAGGLITAVPLILFAIGAQKLPLYVIGLLQFLAPSMTFILAVWVYDEPFDLQKGITFLFVWLGLSIYVFDAINAKRRRTAIETS